MDWTNAIWRKAKRSNDGGNCVEVATRPGHVGVRDSKDPEGPVLTVSTTAFSAFLDEVRAGQYDRQ